MVKVSICGAYGKMGNEVRKVLENKKNYELLFEIDKGDISLMEDKIQDSDLIIDFSAPDSCIAYAEIATKAQIPFVSGTTGLSEEQFQKLQELGEKNRIFYAANFSYGISLLNQILAEYSGKLKEYDIEIIEKHHNQKKDAPSGTAITLSNTIKSNLSNYKEKYGRHGKEELRDEKEIGMHSIRAGGIFGEHELLFGAENEIIKFSHTAISRKLFAEGAVKAADFLLKKEANGFYKMTDLIKEA